MSRPSADAVARLALSSLVEPGLWSVHEAVAAHGAEQVWTRLREGRPLGALTPALVDAARARAVEHDVERDLGRLAATGEPVRGLAAPFGIGRHRYLAT